MKIFFLLFLSLCALAFAGCADESLLTDEEYRAVKGPAPYSPDPMQHIPDPNQRPDSGVRY